MWKIACIQLDIQFGDVNHNYAIVEKKVKEASENNADIIILPEMWNTGYDLERVSTIGDKDGKRTKSFLKELAIKHQVNIVGGSIAEVRDTGVFNTLLAVNRKGEVVGTYRKAHLFQLMEEHYYLHSGSQLGLFQLDNIMCGANICYDIRFPEWFRSHIYHGAIVMFVVAQWPSQRMMHWETLLKARAIENQCYVIACNRVGTDINNQFVGHSMIINPWGEIVVLGQQESIVYGSIDIDKVNQARRKIPIFEDCRQNLYKRQLINNSLKDEAEK
ncbi:MAG: carbon-nitrogen family hydrolase [Bacillaceae bacterium]